MQAQIVIYYLPELAHRDQPAKHSPTKVRIDLKNNTISPQERHFTKNGATRPRVITRQLFINLYVQNCPAKTTWSAYLNMRYAKDNLSASLTQGAEALQRGRRPMDLWAHRRTSKQFTRVRNQTPFTSKLNVAS